MSEFLRTGRHFRHLLSSVAGKENNTPQLTVRINSQYPLLAGLSARVSTSQQRSTQNVQTPCSWCARPRYTVESWTLSSSQLAQASLSIKTLENGCFLMPWKRVQLSLQMPDCWFTISTQGGQSHCQHLHTKNKALKKKKNISHWIYCFPKYELGRIDILNFKVTALLKFSATFSLLYMGCVGVGWGDTQGQADLSRSACHPSQETTSTVEANPPQSPSALDAWCLWHSTLKVSPSTWKQPLDCPLIGPTQPD